MLSEVKYLVQGHTASRQWSWDLNPSFEAHIFTNVFHCL